MASFDCGYLNVLQLGRVFELVLLEVGTKPGSDTTPRGWPKLGGMLPSKSKVQHLFGAFNPLGSSDWGNLISP